MPLHEARAEGWLWEHVPCNKIHLGFKAACSAPLRSARGRASETIDRNGKFSREETQDILARLREFIADGAGEETHPDHQTFCDGVRIASDYGTF